MRTSSELSLVIAPRQGSYEGMPAERAYQVVFLLEEEPREVSVNGVMTDNWTYDAQMQQVTVTLPVMPCDQETVITLQRSANGISQIGDATVVSQRYFDLQGREYTYVPQGSYILQRTWSNGRTTTQKYMR